MPTEPTSSPITSRPPRAQMTRALVQPPARVYLELTDRLYIRSRNSLAGVVLRIAGRLLLPDGSITPFSFTHTPATDRSALLEAFRLAEGFLLSCVVFPSSGAPMRGQTFVELGFLRGIGGADDVVNVLAKDYVAEAEPVAFPGSPIRSSLEGPGAIRSITGTDPAAGVEISDAVPANARWRFYSARIVLATDATVTNRLSSLEFTDGTLPFFRSGAIIQSASLSSVVTYAGTGQEDASNSLRRTVPIPPGGVLLGAGFTITTQTENIVPGDNFAAPQYHVEEWIED